MQSTNHGCTQNAKEFSELTQIMKHPMSHEAFLLFPEQSKLRNLTMCWNWFLKENQKRNMNGEMRAIVDKVNSLIKKYPIDPNRIYVGGFSAGAVLALNMSVCFPDVFKGALIHSGVAFKTLSSLFDIPDILSRESNQDIETLIQKARNCSGLDSTHFKLNSVFIFHGKKDPVTRQSFGQNTFLQMQGFLEGKGDVKIFQLPDMGHAWSGGAEGYQMSYPKGPSATNFFLDHL